MFSSFSDSPYCTEEWNKRKDHIVRYMNEVEKGFHSKLALKYVVCEVFAFVVLVS
jgi:hypothetical protein